MGSDQTVPGAVDLMELRRPEESAPSVAHIGLQNVMLFCGFQPLYRLRAPDVQLAV